MSNLRIVCLLALCVTWLLGCSANNAEEKLKGTADAFLFALSQHNYEKARRYLTSELAQKTPSASFQQFSTFTGINKIHSHTWKEINLSSDTAELIGYIRQNDSQRNLPLRLTLDKEQGNWRISTIQRGVFIGPGGDDAVFAPGKEECARLAQATTAAFATAVRSKDLDSFRMHTSSEFQDRFSKAAFHEAFGNFIDNHINIGPAAKLNPVFTEIPSLTAGGKLKLVGYFPSQPSRVSFFYEYTSQRSTGWVLSGISLDVKPLSTR